MANSGNKSPITCVNKTDIGTVQWSNPNNAILESTPNSVANNLNNSEISNYLYCYNFDISVPLGAVITGVEFSLKLNDANGTSNILDYDVRLVRAGEILSNSNLATNSHYESDTYITYGSSAEQWGETLIPSMIESSDFGVVFAVQSSPTGTASDYQIDGVIGKVYFDEETQTGSTIEIDDIEILMSEQFKEDFANIGMSILLQMFSLVLFISLIMMFWKRIYGFLYRRLWRS